LSKLVIAERIASLKEERSNRVQLTADDVLRDLIELKDICLGRKEITVTDSDGALTTTKLFEHAGANKALENLGKHLKMFTDKQEITGKDGAPLIPESIKVIYE
jgi:phage terminase small subunit